MDSNTHSYAEPVLPSYAHVVNAVTGPTKFNKTFKSQLKNSRVKELYMECFSQKFWNDLRVIDDYIGLRVL